MKVIAEEHFRNNQAHDAWALKDSSVSAARRSRARNVESFSTKQARRAISDRAGDRVQLDAQRPLVLHQWPACATSLKAKRRTE